MAKFKKASDIVVSLFASIRDKTTIPPMVTFEILCNYKQNSIYKIVKLNDFGKILTDRIVFVVVFNEKILIQLSKKLQTIVVKECLDCVSVSQSDTISLAIPNFHEYVKILEQYEKDLNFLLHL